MTPTVIRSLDENQPDFPLLSGPVKLAFGGRNTRSILEAVGLAEESHIQSAMIHLAQIHFIRPAITGREIFKEKYREIPAQ